MVTQTQAQAVYPARRLRRLRRSPTIRRLVRETTIRAEDFIYPLFISEGRDARRPVSSMPGVFQFSVDEALQELESIASLGISSVLLFGIPESKDELGKSAYDPDGIIPRAIRAIKQRFPELVVMTDVCLCEYTDHGHCGVVRGEEILNDPTVELLVKESLAHAQAGADVVAPSDMMDGRVGAIRRALDERGFDQVAIMSYAAKYASGFYGPFREAAESTPRFGDRRSHQMDPANAREALLEIELDLEEGADIVMVKPALAYLDVIHRARQISPVPLAAYNVSGEYSMVKAAAQMGWIDERRATLEILQAIKRAGADLIISYHAPQALRWLKEGGDG